MLDRRVPLIDLVGQGLINDVRTLIKNGCNVDEQDYYGGSAVLKCVERNDDAILEVLIEAKANLDVTDQVGTPILQLAEEFKHHKIVKLIKDTLAQNNKTKLSDPKAQSEGKNDTYDGLRFYPKGTEQYQDELKSGKPQDEQKDPLKPLPSPSSVAVKTRK